jgi:dimethylhistidine N-methyltransferase
MLEQFKTDVDHGLSASPKRLSSKYFYDEIGDDLFVQIMHLPEYYLTRSEFEIFEKQTREIVDSLCVNKDVAFDLIELGAGDGTKTKMLLKHLVENQFDFRYLPIDISSNALEKLEQDLKYELPELQVETQQGDYFEVLESLKHGNRPKVLLFLGSNIGNLSDDEARKFIYQLGSNIKPDDRLLLGVDLIKSEDVVLPAYNDAKGITRAFNMNLLRRMNNELGADFNLDLFDHRPEYSEQSGIARSFIESLDNQEVTISSLNKSFQFKKGERIHTEISRKYNDDILHGILEGTDFEITQKLMDSNGYFADYILTRR